MYRLCNIQRWIAVRGYHGLYGACVCTAHRTATRMAGPGRSSVLRAHPASGVSTGRLFWHVRPAIVLTADRPGRRQGSALQISATSMQW